MKSLDNYSDRNDAGGGDLPVGAGHDLSFIAPDEFAASYLRHPAVRGRILIERAQKEAGVFDRLMFEAGLTLELPPLTAPPTTPPQQDDRLSPWPDKYLGEL